MKFNFPMNNFTSGEWSPRMRGRTDVEQYPRACQELLNMLVQMTGGAAYRGGTSIFPNLTTTMINDMNDYANTGAGQMRLLPYMPYDTTKRAVIMAYPKAVLAQDVKVYSVASGWVNITSMTIVNFGNWADYNYVQLGDLLVLADKTGITSPIVFWHDGTAYRAENYDFYASGQLGIQQWQSIPMANPQALNSGVTITPGATMGTGVTFTVGAAPNGDNAFDLQNKLIRFSKGAVTSGYALTNFTAVNATTIYATIYKTLPAAGVAYGSTGVPDSFLQISEWDSSQGYPRTVTAHQGRLLFGGTRTKPDTVWGSQISNFFKFQEVPEPDTTGPYGFAGGAYAADNSRAFAMTPNSKEASNIQALSASKTLTIHTDRSEIVAYGSNGALGPNNVVFESSTSFGSDRVQPERVNNFLTFVQSGGRKVRDIIFNFNEDQYKSSDLSFVVEHLFRDVRGSGTGADAILELTRTEGDSSILWARTQFGKLYAVTLDRDYEINAWSRINLGKSPYQTAESKVLAFTNFKFAADSDEVLVLMVSRRINGVDSIVLEYMNNPWAMDNIYNISTLGPFGNGITARPHYLDFAMDAYPTGGTYPNTSWNLGLGLAPVFNAYYKNTTVSVIADGIYVGEVAIGADANANFTLAEPASEVQVGFKYLGRLVTMPIEQGGQTGVPVGRQKRVDELTIKFVSSLNCSFGHSEDTMEDLDFRDPDQPMNQGPDYFTGEKSITFPAGYERALQVIIEQTKPYPMHIAAVVPRGATYD